MEEPLSDDLVEEPSAEFVEEPNSESNADELTGMGIILIVK